MVTLFRPTPACSAPPAPSHPGADKTPGPTLNRAGQKTENARTWAGRAKMMRAPSTAHDLADARRREGQLDVGYRPADAIQQRQAGWPLRRLAKCLDAGLRPTQNQRVHIVVPS